MIGEENNIKIIKLLYGTNHSPNRIENDTHKTSTSEQTSTENIINFLYERGIVRILFIKTIFN
mgnify:CR=1 FL=1